MMTNFCTFLEGVKTNNPYNSPTVIFAHPNSNNALILAEFDTYSWNPNWEGFLKASNRTAQGSLILNGDSSIKPFMNTFNVDCIVNQIQLDCFNELLFFQNYTKVPVTIQDTIKRIQFIGSTYMATPNWLSGYPTTNEIGYSVGFAAFNVWINVDPNYATQIGPDMYKLQCVCENVF